ncbi:MAG: antitoxin [Holophagales bacterium]|nr:antitoxin [Holophagales bacterium]MXX61678.1 antitoxin [Holophagales bacterium]MYC09676.1 antitoxin [Holophagales bacterium]MYD22661.1 antitoxin [Holophagales bacterium]MYI31616.1 antitoxin [Holophagales bacterium]
MRRESQSDRQRQDHRPFKSVAEVQDFFRQCDADQARGVEPDWDEHLVVIRESRRRGKSGN